MNFPNLRVAVAIAAGYASSLAVAAPPVAVDLTPGFSFVEYAGSAPVGQGAVNTPSTLFYIDEQTAAGYKSWYVFLDPGRPTQDLLATLRFDQPIAAVLTTRAELDATNAVYGAPTITYGSRHFMGIEACPLDRIFCDAVTWTAGATELALDWSAVHPGDHIRVLVVPEPSSVLLLGAGLLALGATLRHRRG